MKNAPSEMQMTFVEIRAAGRSTLHIQTSQLGEQRATANGHPDGRPGCPTIDRLWGKDKIIKSSHDTLIMSCWPALAGLLAYSVLSSQGAGYLKTLPNTNYYVLKYDCSMCTPVRHPARQNEAHPLKLSTQPRSAV